MTHDPTRHSPGPAPIEPKKSQRSGGSRGQPTERRERDHVEGQSHVERVLPKGGGAWRNEGEGNTTADRAYRRGTEEFARSGRVDEQARKAADALEGAEGDDLRKAEEKGRSGKHG